MSESTGNEPDMGQDSESRGLAGNPDTPNESLELPASHDNVETSDLENMILSTGIRVGTPVKTKYMAPFILKANPEGLYILDISKTLARIDVAAEFIGRSYSSKV